MRRCFAIAVGFAVLGAVGCGQTEAPPSGPPQQFPGFVQEKTGNTLKGKVLVNGNPMPQGFVWIYSEKAPIPAAAGMIGPTGEYEAENVPLGNIQIVVSKETTGVPPTAPGVEMPGGPPGMDGPPGGPPGMPKMPPGMKAPEGPKALTREQQKLLDAVEKKYGSLTAGGILQFTVVSGINQHDLKLDVKP